MSQEADNSAQEELSKIDTSVPQSARIWNYWLGGKDNYEVDRVAGDAFRAIFPGIETGARAARYFLARAVRHLAAEEGVRQFLDIGTGLPNVDNTHEIAQRVAPECRIVYVDNDPLVLAHARALLTSSPEGRTDYLDEDLRNVDAILEHAAKTLDFSEPVALILLGVVIFVGDDEDPYSLVRRLVDRLPAGSHLVLSHTITSPSMPDVDEAVKFWNEHGTPKLTQRTPENVARFFDGLELLEPGVLSCSRWRPEDGDAAEPEEVAMFGGVARKP